MSGSQKALLLAVVAAAAGLRLAGIGSESLWEDEAYTIYTSDLPAADLVFETADHVNPERISRADPPLYYLFMKAWMQAFGRSETAIRLPSALFGVLGVVATFSLGRIISGRCDVGIFAAWLLALSGLHVEYSQEARTYTMVTATAAAAATLLVAALRDGGRRRWLGYVGVAAIGAYFHLQMLFVIFGLGAAGILSVACSQTLRPRLKAFLAAEVALAVLLIPDVAHYAAASLLAGGAYDFWQPHANWERVARALLTWTIGCPWPRFVSHPPPWLTTGIVVAAAALPLVPVRAVDRDRRWAARLCGLALLVGATTFVCAAMFKPVWHLRYVIAFQPLYLSVAACAALWVPGTGWRRRIVLTAMSVAMMPHLAQKLRGEARPDYRTASAWITARQQPGDRVVAPELTGPVFKYYGLEGLSLIRNPGDASAAELTDAAVAGAVFVVISETRDPDGWSALANRLAATSRTSDIARFNNVTVRHIGPG